MKTEYTEKQKQVIENIKNICEVGELFNADDVSDNKTRIALFTLKDTGHVEYVKTNSLNGMKMYRRLI